MDSTQIVREYYNQAPQLEWERIEGRPELALTSRFIDRYVKPGDRVLDIGGGPGRYSLYLAERGCDVTLLDLSDANVTFAAARAAERGVGLCTVRGDARQADRLVVGQFDHVLLMGPLYHLLEESDRVRAVNASLELLKPGGVLFVSFINLFAGVIYAMKLDPASILTQESAEFFDMVLSDRNYAGRAFTQAFFINVQEVLPFMSRFGLEKLHYFGQESITSPCEDKIFSVSPEVSAAWLDMAERLCERESLLNWSEHLMYVGRKPTGA